MQIRWPLHVNGKSLVNPNSESCKLFYLYSWRLLLLDPLQQLKDANSKAVIPDDVFTLVTKRFPIVIEGINRIERASNIQFPIAYVEPSMVTTTTDPSIGYGILYARTIPVHIKDTLKIIIQITAPLIAYGLKGTIHAVLAHEFLHYLELVWRISNMRIVSDQVSSSLFENAYSDESRLFDPRAVFNDRTLITHITKRFPSRFRDYRLEDKVNKYWQQRHLPRTSVAIDENIIKIPAISMASTKFDPDLIRAVNEISDKQSKLRKKRLY